MSVWLEIIMPVRNPGSKLLESGASLIAQTERGFGVVLSDNSSTSGADIIATFCGQLAAAGIPVRHVKPPQELGRVQHWNWAHAQGGAEWLKPLFVGDLLKPGYVQALHRRIQARAGAQIVRCEFESRSSTRTDYSSSPFTQDSLTPSEFLDQTTMWGNWIGGPINVAYRRDAYQAVGGYPIQIPALADYKLNCMLALHHGIEVIHEHLTIFQLHEQRFSYGIRGRRVNGCLEVWLILRMMHNYCLTRKLPWPPHGVWRGVKYQLKVDHWYPFKKRVKFFLHLE